MRLLIAPWVLPAGGPPLSRGAVAVDGAVIRAVGPAAALRRAHPEAIPEEVPGLLLPGLVNCHTHLELGGLRPPAGFTGPFVEWLLWIIEAKRALDESALARAAREGAAALVRAGTTCVGDVGESGLGLPALQEAGLRGIAYAEVLGLDADRADAILTAARERIRIGADPGGRLAGGLSPHSPYGCSEALLRACAAALGQEGIRAQIHLAESAAEVAYVATGGGEIREKLLPAVGRREPAHLPRGESPVAYALRLGLLNARPVCVHAVETGPRDWDALARAGAAVAHCPRSNAFLGVGPAPAAPLRAHGVPVGLGTDSRASAPSLSLWDEMRFALEVHAGALSAEEVFRMATLEGARALGLDGITGSLEAGKRADLIAVRADRFDPGDPFGSLIRHTADRDVLLTMVDGEVLFRV